MTDDQAQALAEIVTIARKARLPVRLEADRSLAIRFDDTDLRIYHTGGPEFGWPVNPPAKD